MQNLEEFLDSIDPNTVEDIYEMLRKGAIGDTDFYIMARIATSTQFTGNLNEHEIRLALMCVAYLLGKRTMVQ